jgi:hypothetical protein
MEIGKKLNLTINEPIWIIVNRATTDEVTYKLFNMVNKTILGPIRLSVTPYTNKKYEHR